MQQRYLSYKIKLSINLDHDEMQPALAVTWVSFPRASSSAGGIEFHRLGKSFQCDFTKSIKCAWKQSQL